MNQWNDRDSERLGFLFESGLSEQPFIRPLIQTAIFTGDRRELDRYLAKNQWLVEAARRQLVADKLLTAQCPFYPFPRTWELQDLAGTIQLGIVNSRGEFFCIFPDSLPMHAMILGRTGTGKSWFNALVLYQLVQASGAGGFNVVVPDVKLFYRRLVGKVPNLNVLTFDRFIFNFLEIPEWMDPESFIFLFSRVFPADNLLGPPSQGLLIEALWGLFIERQIFEGSRNYGTLKTLYDYIKRLQGHKVLGFRYKDIFEAVFNRLRPYVFLENNFGAPRGISHEVFTQENVVVELPLNRISTEIHNFLVSWLANLTYARNMEMGLRGNKLRTLFLVDEASTLLSASRERSDLGWIEPGITDVIRKGREFGLGLWLCSQESTSFTQVFRSNCLLKITFSLTDGEDVKEIKKSFGLNEEQKNYLYKLPDSPVAVCRHGSFEHPFLLEVPRLNA